MYVEKYWHFFKGNDALAGFIGTLSNGVEKMTVHNSLLPIWLLHSFSEVAFSFDFWDKLISTSI